MRAVRLSGGVAFAMMVLLAGCGGQKQNAEGPKADPAGFAPYVPPDGTFAIKVPNPPEILGYGNAPKRYKFYGTDVKAAGPLLTINVSPIAPPNAAGAPPPIAPERYEQGYRAEPGAVVSGKEISLGTYTGREIDITAGQRAPLTIRIYLANGRMYWLEWNSTIAHSTEVADTFTMP
jgi:hypothetical protein